MNECEGNPDGYHRWLRKGIRNGVPKRAVCAFCEAEHPEPERLKDPTGLMLGAVDPGRGSGGVDSGDPPPGERVAFACQACGTQDYHGLTEAAPDACPSCGEELPKDCILEGRPFAEEWVCDVHQGVSLDGSTPCTAAQ